MEVIQVCQIQKEQNHPILMALALPGFFLLILTASFPRSSLFTCFSGLVSLMLGLVLGIPMLWRIPLTIFVSVGVLAYLATRVKVEFKWDFRL